MKSACSFKGDDARQRAVGLRTIAVSRGRERFYVSRTKALGMSAWARTVWGQSGLATRTKCLPAVGSVGPAVQDVVSSAAGSRVEKVCSRSLGKQGWLGSGRGSLQYYCTSVPRCSASGMSGVCLVLARHLCLKVPYDTLLCKVKKPQLAMRGRPDDDVAGGFEKCCSPVPCAARLPGLLGWRGRGGKIVISSW